MTIAKFAVVSASFLALAACQQEAAAPVQNGTAPAEAGNAAPAQGGNQATANLWNDGAAKPLDTQVAHPNGTVLQLTSLQSRPTDTVVGFRVINGRERDVELNRFNSNQRGYLVLDNGERLYLSPPATNTRLSIPAARPLKGSWCSWVGSVR